MNGFVAEQVDFDIHIVFLKPVHHSGSIACHFLDIADCLFAEEMADLIWAFWQSLFFKK